MRGFDEQLVALYPYLFRLAMTRCGVYDQAEDLVQETMLKAVQNADKFQLGTNIRAWTTVILHNTFLSNIRRLKLRQRHMLALEGGDHTVDAKEQFYHVAFKQAMEWMERLPAEQRRALEMIGLEGHSYKDVATMADVAIGTIKSRTSRARVSMRAHAPE